MPFPGTENKFICIIIWVGEIFSSYEYFLNTMCSDVCSQCPCHLGGPVTEPFNRLFATTFSTPAGSIPLVCSCLGDLIRKLTCNLRIDRGRSLLLCRTVFPVVVG